MCTAHPGQVAVVMASCLTLVTQRRGFSEKGFPILWLRSKSCLVCFVPSLSLRVSRICMAASLVLPGDSRRQMPAAHMEGEGIGQVHSRGKRRCPETQPCETQISAGAGRARSPIIWSRLRWDERLPQASMSSWGNTRVTWDSC